MKYSIAFLVSFAIVASFLVFSNLSVFASVQEEIDVRTKEIEELQRQIADYQQQILETSSKANTLNTEISRLNSQILKIQLEIKSLNLSISQTDDEIEITQTSIAQTQDEITVHKKALGSALLVLYQADTQNLTEVLLKNSHLSDFFNNIKTLDDAQSTMRSSIVGLKNLKADLENKETTLQDKRLELQELEALQVSQRRVLDQSKAAKDQLLKQTKGEESKYQALLNQSKDQLKRIQEQITYLQQSGISVEDAVKYGQLTADRVGIRPAFELAILEIETRLGQNIGSGNWKDDMYLCYLRLADIYPTRKSYYVKRAEDEKAAFLKITGALGLDPNVQKVSKEPSYGCGGAMGPAQFIPTTWLGYQERISAYTGHSVPNPWSIEDAFMAAAIKLANDGATAKTRTAEIKAAKSYISGNANCNSNICNYYANLAQDKAAIIEQNL